MRLDANISVDSARLNTKAPFTDDSSLLLDGASVDPAVFVSIKVACDEYVRPPVHISQIEPVSGTAWSMWFSDSLGRRVCRAVLTDDMAIPGHVDTYLLLTTENIVRGHLSILPAICGQLLSVLHGITAPTDVPPDCFVLLPFCITPYMTGVMKSVEVAGQFVTTPVRLLVDKYVYATDRGAPSLSVAQAPVPPDQTDGFKWLRVDNVDTINGNPAGDGKLWIGGCHLVLRHGIASNIRVTAGGGTLKMSGVADG